MGGIYFLDGWHLLPTFSCYIGVKVVLLNACCFIGTPVIEAIGLSLSAGVVGPDETRRAEDEQRATVGWRKCRQPQTCRFADTPRLSVFFPGAYCRT